jgi:hypothetical protein
LSKCNSHNYLQLGVFFQYATLNNASPFPDTLRKISGICVAQLIFKQWSCHS